MTVGRRQVVRQETLNLPSDGSTPSASANIDIRKKDSRISYSMNKVYLFLLFFMKINLK